MKVKSIFIAILLLLPLFRVYAETGQGRKLYNANCSACHYIGGGDFVGPDLKSVNELREEDWLISFIRSSQTMIREGDELAVELYEAYNRLVMPDFPGLSEDDIRVILQYIDEQSEEAAAKSSAVTDQDASQFGVTGTRKQMDSAVYFDNSLVFNSIYFIAMLLIIIVSLTITYYIEVISKH